MAKVILDRLVEKFGDAILQVGSFRGDEVAYVKRERILEILRFLRDDADLAMNLARSVTAIDFLGREPAEGERFEVVYLLYSIGKKHSVRLNVPVPEDDPTIDSCVELYPGMNWAERECWDMYGIRFKGHPDMRRLFMYEEFVGHPLRKDYPKEKRQPLIRREGMV